jgi:hypothetical protein
VLARFHMWCMNMSYDTSTNPEPEIYEIKQCRDSCPRPSSQVGGRPAPGRGAPPTGATATARHTGTAHAARRRRGLFSGLRSVECREETFESSLDNDTSPRPAMVHQ